jgi:hypothetical protein
MCSCSILQYMGKESNEFQLYGCHRDVICGGCRHGTCLGPCLPGLLLEFSRMGKWVYKEMRRGWAAAAFGVIDEITEAEYKVAESLGFFLPQVAATQELLGRFRPARKRRESARNHLSAGRQLTGVRRGALPQPRYSEWKVASSSGQMLLHWGRALLIPMEIL